MELINAYFPTVLSQSYKWCDIKFYALLKTVLSLNNKIQFSATVCLLSPLDRIPG